MLYNLYERSCNNWEGLSHQDHQHSEIAGSVNLTYAYYRICLLVSLCHDQEAQKRQLRALSMPNLNEMVELMRHLIFHCSNRNLVQLGFNEAVRGNARMCKPRVGWIKAVETIVEFANVEWCCENRPMGIRKCLELEEVPQYQQGF